MDDASVAQCKRYAIGEVPNLTPWVRPTLTHFGSLARATLSGMGTQNEGVWFMFMNFTICNFNGTRYPCM